MRTLPSPRLVLDIKHIFVSRISISPAQCPDGDCECLLPPSPCSPGSSPLRCRPFPFGSTVPGDLSMVVGHRPCTITSTPSPPPLASSPLRYRPYPLGMLSLATQNHCEEDACRSSHQRFTLVDTGYCVWSTCVDVGGMQKTFVWKKKQFEHCHPSACSFRVILNRVSWRDSQKKSVFKKRKNSELSWFCSFWDIPVVGRETEIRARESGIEPLFLSAFVNSRFFSFILSVLQRMVLRRGQRTRLRLS